MSAHALLNVLNDFGENIRCETCGLSMLLHGVISLPEATSYDKGSIMATR